MQNPAELENPNSKGTSGRAGGRPGPARAPGLSKGLLHASVRTCPVAATTTHHKPGGSKQRDSALSQPGGQKVKPRCGQGLRGTVFLPVPGSGGRHIPWLWPRHPISASVSTAPSPLLWVSSLPLPPFYHDTVTGFRTKPWMISSQHGYLHPSATALFTNKATFASPRDGMWLSLVEPFSGSHRRAAG